MWHFTSRNQPKCNHSIYDYMRLLSFATRFGNTCNYMTTFNYFVHFLNYDATIRNFILLIASILHLFSSITTLICPISCNSRQISCILKVFYNDIRMYFNVCIKIIYIIYIHMYIAHIMNLKINI
jgi:hypothetical protein